MVEMPEIAAGKALARAREARRAGDAGGAVLALQDAVRHADAGRDPALRHQARWRLAKALHDSGRDEELLDVIAPVLEEDDAFEHYDAALRAAEPLGLAAWSGTGYRHAALDRLWDRWAAACTARGEGRLAARALARKAWQLGCRGDLSGVRDLLTRVLALSPKQVDDDAAALLGVHRDVAHTLLRTATWGGSVRDALDALDIWLDAAAEADTAPEADYWLVEAALAAGVELDRPDLVERFGPALLGRVPPARAELHQPLARGLLGLETSPDALCGAARAALDARWGPEWAIYAWRVAARLGADTEPLARELAASRHVDVFYASSVAGNQAR